MGVMSCSKNQCTHIMCDTYVNGVGYICSDCQKEFKLYLTKKGIIPVNEFQMKEELKKFLEEEPGKFVIDNTNIDIIVNKFFSNYER